MFFFFFNDTATTEIYTTTDTLSLHDALPISARGDRRGLHRADRVGGSGTGRRSDRAVVRGGGHRRPGKPPRCGARRGDGRPGALGRHPLPAAGRAVRDLPGDGDGARVQAARAVQHRRGEEDMSRDRTPRTLALILLALLVSGQFLPQWTLFLVTVALAKGLVVLGLMILLRCGLVSFGQALYYCIGAYAAGMLGRLFGASDVFTLMLAGMAAAGRVGFVLGFLLARYRSIFFGLLSLAVSMILYGLLVKTEALGSTDGFHVLPSTLFGLRPADAWVRYTVLAVALLVAFLAALLVHRYLGTPLGRLAPAIKDNEIRVEYMGASARRAVHVKYVIAAVLAGVGGALAATTVGHIDPDMAYWTSSGEFIFIAILAGTGNVLAPFVGALVYGAIHTMAYDLSPNTWQMSLGVALLVLIVFLPEGLLSFVSKLSRRARHS